MESKFTCHPAYRQQIEYPVAAWICGLLAMVKSVFWLLGETAVVSHYYLLVHIVIGVLYLVFGVGVWNVRKWAFNAIIVLSTFDILFMIIFPDALPGFFSSLRGVKVIQSAIIYVVPGIVGSFIVLGLAIISRRLAGNSRHFEKLYKEKTAVSKGREWGEVIVTAIVLALIIRAYSVQAFKIPSGSMIPTLQIGDHLLVNKFLYGTEIPFLGKRILAFKEPQRGDIIVFKYPKDESRDFIKRVIGVGGDVVEERDKRIFVNGEPLRDEHAVHMDPDFEDPSINPRDTFGPITVPEGKYFVMGDNRDFSHDSRYWGFVDKSEILGKAFLIYWSWDGKKFLPRLGRIGNLVR
jgi:signal peptidase I